MWVRRSWTTVLAVALAVVLAAAPVSAAKGGNPGGGGGGGDTTAEPVPVSMSSIGDSITRAFNACGWYVDCAGRSWSTGGSSDRVTSHYERLRALDPKMSAAYNDARSGAKVADLPAQARTAASRGVGYVTILMGANDACTSSEAAMTSVADFRSHVDAAMAELAPATTGRKVFVASIPDVYRLWQVGKGSSSARSAWSGFGICQSLLANPTSTDPADEDRRRRVQQRVIDFNAQLAAECAEHVGCRYDGGAVFGYPFELSHLSGWDYFHPNESGQAILAAETFAVGFEWAAASTKGGGRR